jgi:hypothetical protein
MRLIGQAWWCISVIPATEEAKVEGLWFKTCPGKVNVRSYIKIKLKAKGLWSVTQVVEHLFIKLKALSSILYTVKKKVNE